MSQELTDPGDVSVGILHSWYPDTCELTEHLTIYSTDEIFVGRDDSCQYQVHHPNVSNTHLRIYTVIYDEITLSDVAPLTYAQDLSSNGTRWNGYPMKGESFLLSSGDVLEIAPSVLLKWESAFDQTNHFSPLQIAEMTIFRNSYRVTQLELGSGAHGCVQMAYQSATGQQVACKTMDLVKIRAKQEEILQSAFFTSEAGPSNAKPPLSVDERMAICYREAQILAKMSHPNIISFESAIHSPDTVYIFTELVTGGDLHSFLRYKHGAVEPTEAAFIIRQILLAVEYLHDRDIVHRDIKPENILITALEAGDRVVLSDFGSAKEVAQPIERMQTIVGTSEYCAPEVNPSNKAGYDKAVDLYSLGRVAVILMTGSMPMTTEEEYLKMELEELGIAGHFNDFLQGLLVHDATQRMDVKQALRHDWFTDLPLPVRDSLEELYQGAIQAWKPRPRSEPAIVTLDTLAFGPDFPFHTRAGWRLPSYRLF